jgi:hypothetical protein
MVWIHKQYNRENFDLNVNSTETNFGIGAPTCQRERPVIISGK